MNDEQIIYCVIAFVLGYLANRMMGNGFSVGATQCEDMLKYDYDHSCKFTNTLLKNCNTPEAISTGGGTLWKCAQKHNVDWPYTDNSCPALPKGCCG